MASSGVTVTREELFDRVWTTPMVMLAKEYGISDVGLAKICKRMEIPRPPRGYWQKLAVGKAPRKPKLSTLSEKGVPRVLITPVQDGSVDTPVKGEKPEPIPVPMYLEEPHRLTERTLTALEKGKPDEKGVVIPKNKIHMDIAVSRDQISRACLVMDTLIKALEERGCQVSVGGEEKTTTNVVVDGETFQFGIDEKIERSDHVPTKEERQKHGDHYWMWPRYDYTPTSRLSMRIRNSPYGSREQWSDGKRQRIEDCLGDFIVGLKAAAQRIKGLREERRLREIEWAEQEKRRAERMRLARMEKERAEKLTRDVTAWGLAGQIRQYVAEVESAAGDIDGVCEWLSWARKYADSIDPLRYPDAIAFRED